MLKTRVFETLYTAIFSIKSAFEGLDALPLQTLEASLQQHLRIEHPRHTEHGDFAANVTFLVRWAKVSPGVVAQAVAEALSTESWLEANTVNGFVNLRLTPATYLQALLPRAQGQPLRLTDLAGQRIHLEYVSANPTGPLHVGHGRWAALGDSLRRVLEANGAKVTTEFYVNDFGQQMNNLANSVWFRCLEALGLGSFPEPAPLREDGTQEKFPYYPGEYVQALAATYLNEPICKQAITTAVEDYGTERLPDDAPLLQDMKWFGRDAMLELQKQLLERLGVTFNVWTLESSLHQEGRVKATLERLKASGHTSKKEGALWLMSSELGDEKDRVLVKSDGSYTYLTADIAYHDLKFETPYAKVINIWGADHHGYIARLKASLLALGHPAEERFTVILGQLVNLLVNGEPVRMGKRTKMLTLDEVTDTVGVDAIRFWLVSRSADTTIDFDMQVAASASEDNPVFYTQYAHARACSVLRTACQPAVSKEGEVLPRVTEAELEAYLKALTPEQWQHALLPNVSATEPTEAEPKTRAAMLNLLKLLETFEEKLSDAARLLSPHALARYSLDLAAEFHSFYAHCRVLTENKQETLARLALILAFKHTLAQALELLGVSAPEQM